MAIGRFSIGIVNGGEEIETLKMRPMSEEVEVRGKGKLLTGGGIWSREKGDWGWPMGE